MVFFHHTIQNIRYVLRPTRFRILHERMQMPLYTRTSGTTALVLVIKFWTGLKLFYFPRFSSFARTSRPMALNPEHNAPWLNYLELRAQVKKCVTFRYPPFHNAAWLNYLELRAQVEQQKKKKKKKKNVPNEEPHNFRSELY